MTNEEMQNTVQFILEQQAQLTVNLDKVAEKLDSVAEKVDRLAEAHLRSEERISRLEQASLLLVEFSRGVDERQDTLTAQLAETDKRLNSLINTVERYISRNGQ
ncbi:MAG TPA: hypothetical protein VFX96_08865 [Pyrinomonadaceae bacterium]|nr:hypothetical protein [Pyrinomonadaceae bacterium]